MKYVFAKMIMAKSFGALYNTATSLFILLETEYHSKQSVKSYLSLTEQIMVDASKPKKIEDTDHKQTMYQSSPFYAYFETQILEKDEATDKKNAYYNIPFSK